MPEPADFTSSTIDLTNSITVFSGLGAAQINRASVEVKEKLVQAAKNVLQQLENPDIAIFRVALGVR